MKKTGAIVAMGVILALSSCSTAERDPLTPPIPVPPGLFGELEEHRDNVAVFAKWTDVQARFEAEEARRSRRACLAGESPRCPYKIMSDFLRSLEGRPPLLQARRVNKFFNLVPYGRDRTTWGRQDYWATPIELIGRRGDCEDYAYAKYAALRKLGFDPADIRLLAVWDNQRNRAHAVLAARIDGAVYLLDNQAALMTRADATTRYRYVYSLTEDYWVRHASAQGLKTRVTAAPGKKEGNMLHCSDWQPQTEALLPDYLVKTYRWAYLDPRNLRLLDRYIVVNSILWGNYRRLQKLALAEFEPGQTILQPACVYGDLSGRLAEQLGPRGTLTLRDISTLQIENSRRKFGHMANIRYAVSDAATRSEDGLDGVCCFFLLHEIPNDYKRLVVNALMDQVRPGGKVVFVDYHKPVRTNPLRPFMHLVFKWWEPYAFGLMHNDIRHFAKPRDNFTWRSETLFGGLYQKTVAQKHG